MDRIACFKVNPVDNVATTLGDAEPGTVTVIGDDHREIELTEPVNLGHKIALRDLAAGEPIVKFGVRIGHASQVVAAGAWVHLHNCASDYDERSQTLDLHTGAATDTVYE